MARLLPWGRDILLNSEYIKDKEGFIANVQGEGLNGWKLLGGDNKNRGIPSEGRLGCSDIKDGR